MPSILPDILSTNVSSANQIFPDAKQTVWSGKDIEVFIAENFDSRVLMAYRSLRPFAYKCDLARYCLLYKIGGLYIDFGVKCVGSLNIPMNKGIMSFREFNCQYSPSWTSLSTAVLWANPERPELKLAIDMIVENCQRRFYGSDPLYPTGPVLLGRAFIAHMAGQGQSEAADDQWVGTRPSVSDFVTPEGALVALRNERQGGDFPKYGLRGTNNYNFIWHERMLYGEPGGATRGHLDLCIALPDGGLRVAGWAQDEERPDTPVGIAVLINDTVVSTFLADSFRADLIAAGIGRGFHGFDVVVKAPLCPAGLADLKLIRASNFAPIGDTQKLCFQTNRSAETAGDPGKSQSSALTESELSALADKLLPYIVQRLSLGKASTQGAGGTPGG